MSSTLTIEPANRKKEPLSYELKKCLQKRNKNSVIIGLVLSDLPVNESKEPPMPKQVQDFFTCTLLHSSIPKMNDDFDNKECEKCYDLLKKKDFAYWERNQLVRYLSKLFPSWLERHPIEDVEWQPDWRNIVFIQFPEGLFSWHIHELEFPYFMHLKFKEGNSWDGSTTEEKYHRLMK